MSTDDLEVIRSNKGHHKVILRGFMYTKHKAMGDKIRWRCVQRATHCKGSIFTSKVFDCPRVTVGHNHMPDMDAVEFARSRTVFAERMGLMPPVWEESADGEPSPVKLEPLDSYQRPAPRARLSPRSSRPPASPRSRPSTSAADTADFFEALNSLAQPSGKQARRQVPQQTSSPAAIKPQPAAVSAPPHQPPQHVPHQLVHRRPLAPKPRPVSPPAPPPPPPEVCLRWNSYHSNMQATFPQLLNNEQFVDVTLACEGRSIKCHKMMLSACSSYFDELLSANPCQHPIVLMKDLKFWEIEALVQFMYRGEVNVGQDKLPSLLAAAEALQIKGLAGPASTPGPSSSHDDEDDSYDNMDYLDQLCEPPSPLNHAGSHNSNVHRARKRRTIAAMPTQQHVPQPPIITNPRSMRLQQQQQQRFLQSALPSTSRPQQQQVSEPPTRKRRVELSPAKVVEALREIKLEPLDVEDDSIDPLLPSAAVSYQPLQRIKLTAFHSVAPPPTTTPTSTAPSDSKPPPDNATDSLPMDQERSPDQQQTIADTETTNTADEPDKPHDSPDPPENIALEDLACASPGEASSQQDNNEDDDEEEELEDCPDSLIQPEVVMSLDSIGDDEDD